MVIFFFDGEDDIDDSQDYGLIIIMMMMMMTMTMTMMMMIIMILELLLMMMTHDYDELDNYNDMIRMGMHIWMMMTMSITIMMIFTCELIGTDCLHTTKARSTSNSVLGTAIYDNGLGKGLNWGPVKPLSGVAVGDFSG
jgi:hypothetical protein